MKIKEWNVWAQFLCFISMVKLNFQRKCLICCCGCSWCWCCCCCWCCCWRFQNCFALLFSQLAECLCLVGLSQFSFHLYLQSIGQSCQSIAKVGHYWTKLLDVSSLPMYFRGKVRFHVGIRIIRCTCTAGGNRFFPLSLWFKRMNQLGELFEGKTSCIEDLGYVRNGAY